MRRVALCCYGGRVQRRVKWGVRRECKKEQERRGDQREANQLVEAAVLGRRKQPKQSFHEGVADTGGILRWLSRKTPERSDYLRFEAGLHDNWRGSLFRMV